MSRTRNKNPIDTFETLVEQHRNGKPQPSDRPQFLALNNIKVREEVFQHRSPEAYKSKQHIRELADAAKVADLDPLTVWWDGKKYTLLDGHHRRMGYMTAGKGTHAVPVEVFEGTPVQALARAASANTKDKLQMSRPEKSNAAWRLVLMADGMSKAKQANAAGISERQVANMRTVKAKLLAQGLSLAAMAEMNWMRASSTAYGRDSEWSQEEEEVRVEKMATALRKALGATADLQPDIFRQALERFSPRLAKALEEDYTAALREDREESEGEPEGAPAGA